ncbi:hypothetical protein [Treponema phagedenis]|uniref:hypothetical protein n=1 Tax=Treponema phagedenis TaxID=162 RepID=UPI0020914FCD|nr:hypothetical protein [Treponema phagedenis]
MKIQVTLQYDNLKPADSLAPLMKEFSLMGLLQFKKNIESNVKPEKCVRYKIGKAGR